MKRALLITICATALAPTLVSAQTLLERQRLGNNTEDITYVTGGIHAGKIAIIDGYDVLAVDPDGTSPPVSLFDTHVFGARSARGIAYVPTTNLFYFGSTVQTDRLFVMDENGNARPPLFIRWPGELPTQFEGMDYIPSSDPNFPDHIAAIAFFADGSSRTEIISLDGVVAREIVPPPFSRLDSYITGLAYLGPGRFLVFPLETLPLGIWVMDLNGMAEGSGPVATLPEARDDVEGLAVLPDRVIAAGYSNGRLFAFDRDFNRTPSLDRDYPIGLELCINYMTWNSDTGEFLFRNTGTTYDMGIYAVPITLDSKRQVVNLQSTIFENGGAVSYLPGENLVAMTNQPFTRSVVFFDAGDGSYVSRLKLDSFPFATWRPRAVAPLPDRRLGLRVAANPTLVQVISRDGTPVMDQFSEQYPNAVIPTAFSPINLSLNPQGLGLATFDPGSGLQLLAGQVIFDLDGGNPRPIDTAALGVINPDSFTFINTGPHAGHYAALESQASTLVIFSIP